MNEIDCETLEALCYELLGTIGEDVKREGLRDTPKRFAAFWKEFIDYDPGNSDTTFESVSVDQLVTVNHIQIWSLCEHHCLPFSCDVCIGYLTKGKVLGLSKFTRIAQTHAHKLQLQERLINDICQDVSEITGSPDVACYAKGRHLCMEMRGVKQAAEMVTSVMLGAFREDFNLRNEFLRMVE